MYILHIHSFRNVHCTYTAGKWQCVRNLLTAYTADTLKLYCLYPFDPGGGAILMDLGRNSMRTGHVFCGHFHTDSIQDPLNMQIQSSHNSENHVFLEEAGGLFSKEKSSTLMSKIISKSP